MVEEITTSQRIWKSGTAMVLNIPEFVQRKFDISKGDYIEVKWIRLIKMSKENSKENDKTKANELPKLTEEE